jgi:hypothetical protein
MSEIDKDIIIELIKQDEVNNEVNVIDIQEEVRKLEKQQEKLLDMRLDEKINEEFFLMKNNKFENDIKHLKDKKVEEKNYHYEEKTQILFELIGSHYRSYNRVNNEVKALLIKNYLFELSVTTKKELQIEESPIFKSSKMLDLYVGTPERLVGKNF